MNMTNNLAMRRRLFNRAERLLKLLQIDAPEDIIAEEVFLIAKAGFGLAPAVLGSKIGVFLGSAVRLNAARCGNFDCEEGTIPVESSEFPLCEACAKQDEIDMAANEKKFEEPEEH